MANNPFDRMIINPLEKPLADDINAAQSYIDQAFRFFLRELYKDKDGATQEGFIADGLSVIASSTPDMTVTVKSGLGFQLVVADVPLAVDGIIGLNDLPPFKPIPLLADFTFAVPDAPSSPNTRIDIIEVKADRFVTDPSNRQVFNELSGQFEPDLLNKTLTWALDGRGGTVNAPSVSTAPISYKVGEAGNPGSAPTTSPGYIKLCEIAVGSDVTEITNVDISDVRVPLGPTKTLTFSAFDMVPYFPDFFQNGQQVDIELADDTGWTASGAGSGNFLVGIPLRLPIGSFIKSATGTIANKGSTNTFTVRLRRCAPGGSVETIDSDSRTTNGDVELADINHRVESGYRYWLNLAASRSESFWLYQATLDYKEF